MLGVGEHRPCHTRASRPARNDCPAPTPSQGYPISDRVACTADSRHEANRAHWNAYVEKNESCPVCGTSQRPVY